MQHSIVKPYLHTLSQSRLTSTSESCLHWVSCSIQPSISCSMWKILFKDFCRISEVGDWFGRWRVMVDWNAVPCPCHVQLSHHTPSDDALDNRTFFTLMDPSSAVYATDEVNGMFYYQNLGWFLFSMGDRSSSFGNKGRKQGPMA